MPEPLALGIPGEMRGGVMRDRNEIGQLGEAEGGGGSGIVANVDIIEMIEEVRWNRCRRKEARIVMGDGIKATGEAELVAGGGKPPGRKASTKVANLELV